MELEEDVVMLYDCMFLHFYIAFNTIAFEVVLSYVPLSTCKIWLHLAIGLKSRSWTSAFPK